MGWRQLQEAMGGAEFRAGKSVAMHKATKKNKEGRWWWNILYSYKDSDTVLDLCAHISYNKNCSTAVDACSCRYQKGRQKEERKKKVSSIMSFIG